MIATQTNTPDAPARGAVDDPVLVDLTRLLLSDERRAIAALRADVSKLDQKLGSDDGLVRAIADQLVAALKVAERENHRDLAGVMAPLVVSGIRSEILNSREMMVEALYPITGRLVKTAVRNAIKQLSEDINRKLEETLSLRPVRLRVRAVITRRRMSDILLTEAMRGRLERLILIERASGAVLAATNAQGLAEPEPDGALDLWGGLVSAIVQFAGHALAETQGELRQLDFGGQIILLRASPLFILAAITTAGSANARLPTAVDEGFLGFLDHIREGKAYNETTALADLHQQVADRSMAAPTTHLWTLKIVALLLAVLLGLGSWHLLTKQRQDAAARQQALQAAQAAFVAQTARLTAVEKTLSAARAEAERAETRAKDATARTQTLQGDMHAEFGKQAARMAVLEQALVTTASATRAREIESAQRITAQLAAQLDTPQGRVEKAVRETAIFFGDDTAYHDPARAAADLKRLAKALADAPAAHLHVVGYGDGSGPLKANLDVARDRAARVVADLAALGVDPKRLRMATTRAPYPIVDEPLNSGRRVVFELAFTSE